MPSNQLGMDLCLPLTVLSPNVLDDLFEIINRGREWKCFGVVACKTTQRDGRTVDKREVAQANRTTSFQYIYTTQDNKERGNHISTKLASFEKLHESSTKANILFVRYHVCLPAPSQNAYGGCTPNPTDVWRQKVTIEFSSSQNTPRSFSYYELVVTVDIQSAKELLGLDDTIAIGLNKIWGTEQGSMFYSTILYTYPPLSFS